MNPRIVATMTPLKLWLESFPSAMSDRRPRRASHTLNNTWVPPPTILESKGMEFEDVTLWSFYSSCPDQAAGSHLTDRR